MNDELDKLDQQIAELNKQRLAILAKTREEDLKTVLQIIADQKITPKELGLVVPDTSTRSDGRKLKTGKKLPAKYRNPANPEQTWSGKGRPPEWFVDYLKVVGQTKDQLLIQP